MKMIAIRVSKRAVHGKVGEGFEQHWQADLHFQPCQWRADAKMHTRTKGCMCLCLPGGVECVGIWIYLWVAIGRGQQQADFLTGRQLVTKKRDILVNKPCEHMERRIKPQRFFDGVVDICGQ